ncbi:hypothetical protein E6C55_00795 [Cohnella fermenti]|uniref:Uncharacterized protein n=1 Tax=Cohnella fermenti TaxID=2565925 RepID=A0A4S4CAU1_9BACL|nr:hypothetical protein [Cohnella fermenti]THF84553.1 hypothetical protein E6C55_00795 [Cohnella fermenti]
MKELLASAGFVHNVVEREAQHEPTVDDEVILPHQVVRVLLPVDVPPVRAERVDLDAHLHSAGDEGEVKVPPAIAEVAHLELRLQSLQAPERRPPYVDDKQCLRIPLPFDPSAPLSRAARNLLLEPLGMGLSEFCRQFRRLAIVPIIRTHWLHPPE